MRKAKKAAKKVAPKGKFTCDQCPDRKFQTPAALGSHKFLIHGIKGTSAGALDRLKTKPKRMPSAPPPKTRGYKRVKGVVHTEVGVGSTFEGPTAHVQRALAQLEVREKALYQEVERLKELEAELEMIGQQKEVLTGTLDSLAGHKKQPRTHGAAGND